jgi:sugar lactone lactonase YvrE
VRRHAKASSAGSSSRQGSRLGRIALAGAFAIALTLLLGASALAQETHPHKGTISSSGTPHGFGSLGGLAVDASGGDLYAADQTGAADETGAVDRFDAAGAFQAPQITGANTPQGALSFIEPSFLAADVAIDASGGGSDGNVYLTDTANNLIDAFDPTSNELIASFGTNGQLNGTDTPKLAFSLPCGLAVDQSNGELYVADWGNNRIWVYDESGAFKRAIADSALNGPCGLALDSAANLYVRNANDGKVLKFDSAGVFQSTLYGPNANDPENPSDDDPSATDVAVNASDDHLFIDAGDRILELESSEAGNGLLRSFGRGDLSASGGIAVDSTSGKVYAADGQTLHVFGALATLPDVSTGDASAIRAHTATISGTIDPAGGPDAQCEFEYGAENGSGGFAGFDHTALCSPAGPYSSFQEVSANLSGLVPRTPAGRTLPVHYRLVGTSANGTTRGESRVFVPIDLPLVRNTSSFSVTATTATLTARIDPNGSETTYQFEYGTSAAYGTTVPAVAGSVGSADVDQGGSDSLSEYPLASHPLSGLQPDTTYHFRVLATNEEGSTEGPDFLFHTPAFPNTPPDSCPNAAIRAAQGAQNVGDCRAFEMVSPVLKNGGDILGDPEYTRAAADGDAVQFSSVSGFADTPGSGLYFSYMGVRSPTGWQAHSLMPPQDAQNAFNASSSLVPVYEGFSEDLSRGIFRALTPLTDDPLAAHTRNLYLREDLRDPATPTDRLLTAPEVPLPPLGTAPNHIGYRPVFAAASADFSHVLFESKLSLTTGVNSTAGGLEKPKLYEWVNGKVRLAGVLPNGQAAKCPDEGEGEETCSSAGQGATNSAFTERTISRDGSRIFFSSPVANAGGFTPETQLYMRLNGTSTVQLSKSERTPPDSNQQGAEFAGASADGRYVYFVDAERLTDDAIGTDAAKDLYRYDTSLPDNDPHNLTFVATSAFDVVGVSDDGSYMYFLAFGGQGVVGEPTTIPYEMGLYVVHDDETYYIGYVHPNDAGNMTGHGGYSLNRSVKQSRVSPNGHFLTFQATEGQGLTGYDHGECVVPGVSVFGCTEAYVYDATANGDTGELSCASCNPSGATAQHDADYAIKFATGNLPRTSHFNRALSDDGRRLFFITRERLLPEDQNGNVQDVYEYDVPTETLHLISTGTGSSDSYLADASASGEDVFFITRDRLARKDIDGAYDMYDARVDGGYPEPPPGPVCEGDSCLIPPKAPDDPTPASAGFKGAGNQAPNRAKHRCRQGRKAVGRKGKERCAKQKKRANHERRTSR